MESPAWKGRKGASRDVDRGTEARTGPTSWTSSRKLTFASPCRPDAVPLGHAVPGCGESKVRPLRRPRTHRALDPLRSCHLGMTHGCNRRDPRPSALRHLRAALPKSCSSYGRFDTLASIKLRDTKPFLARPAAASLASCLGRCLLLLTKTILGGVVSRTQTPFHANTSHACLELGGKTATRYQVCAPSRGSPMIYTQNNLNVKLPRMRGCNASLGLRPPCGYIDVTASVPWLVFLELGQWQARGPSRFGASVFDCHVVVPRIAGTVHCVVLGPAIPQMLSWQWQKLLGSLAGDVSHRCSQNARRTEQFLR